MSGRDAVMDAAQVIREARHRVLKAARQWASRKTASGRSRQEPALLEAVAALEAAIADHKRVWEATRRPATAATEGEMA
jgi:hypothetical protein